MANRVYFDQQVIQNHFATFSSDELYQNKSVFSLMLSYFSQKDDQEDILLWNSSFSFAQDPAGTFSVLTVGHSIFLINSNKKIISHNLSNSSSFKKSFVAISDQQIAVLYNGKIHFFNHSLEPEKDLIKISNIEALQFFCISNEFFILTSNSIINAKNLQTKLAKIQSNFTLSVSSNSSIALIGKNSVTVVSSDMTTVSPPVSNMANPQDATFSTDGDRLFVLNFDGCSNVHIFDVSEGWKQVGTIEIAGSSVRHVVSWVNTHFVCYDDLGSLFFVSVSTHQAQQQPIKACSVLFGTKTGFLMVEYEDRIDDFVTFNLKSFTAVTAEELYSRSCEQGFFGDALVLMRTFGFDKDVYYKNYVLRNPLTERLIDDDLFNIADKDWIYRFCRDTVAQDETPEIARKLIKAGLRVREDDENLLRQKERLKIYCLMVKSQFKASEWKEFRDCNIEEKAKKIARRSLFQRLGIILKNSTEITEKTKSAIISSISPLVRPIKYAELITKDAESFRQRALFIDDVCGQTQIVSELLNFGFRSIPELKIDVEMITEFDHYINDVAPDFASDAFGNVDCSIYMKYSDYVSKLNDEQRLFLFALNSNDGKELSEKLFSFGKTIIDRSYSASLNFVLNDPISKESSLVFPSLQLAKRIVELKTVLANKLITSSFRNNFCNSAISSFKFPFSAAVCAAFIDNWSTFGISKENRDFLTLAKYAAVYDKPIFFTRIDEIDSSIITDGIAAKIARNPQKEWVNFYNFAKNLKPKFATKYIEKLKEINMSAMIVLQRFDDIEVSTDKERNIVIENVYKLLNNAQSCDINDPMISSAIQCLAVIPTDLKTNQVNEIFKLISMYQHIYKISSSITPRQIHESQDRTSMIVEIINSKHFVKNDLKLSEKVVKFCEEVKKSIEKIDGVDHQIINSELAATCLKFSGEETNNECLLYGANMLDKSSDEVKLRYLNEKRWNNETKKESICDNEIRNADKSILPSFVDHRVEFLTEKFSVGTDRLAILDFMSRIRNAENKKKIFAFCFSFIKSENMIEMLEEYCTKCKNPLNVTNLLQTLLEEGVINNEQVAQLNKFNENVLKKSGSVDKQLEFIVKAEKSGAKISDDTKLKIYTSKAMAEMNLEFNSTETSPEKVAGLILNSKNKIAAKAEAIVELLQVWNQMGLIKNLSEKDLFELVSIVPQKSLIQNRKLFADIFTSEENELKFFNKSKNLLFAATSSYQKVVDKALNADSISPEIIDLVIEFDLTYIFANSDHFESILSMAKSKAQIAEIVKSLKEHSMINALCRMANICFKIPKEFTSPKNAEQVLKWIDATIC